MKRPSFSTHRRAGFSLAEVMIAMSLATLGLGLSLGTFLFGMRMMYKDNQRLATNTSLRYFTAQVSKETVDSSEFYLFPTYQSLDASVDLTTDVSPLVVDAYGTEVAHGDCLVLVTRVSVDDTSNVRQIRIYYRTVTTSNNEGAIRYYEGTDYGATGTTTALVTLLNAIDLKTYPSISGSRQMAARARGRLKPASTTQYYPIFSSENSSATPTNENVSINVEFINGSTVNNVLSSSSFNYTISPRR